jgi:hypothetical protein
MTSPICTRRHFLKAAGCVAGSLALGGSLKRSLGMAISNKDRIFKKDFSIWNVKNSRT